MDWHSSKEKSLLSLFIAMCIWCYGNWLQSTIATIFEPRSLITKFLWIFWMVKCVRLSNVWYAVMGRIVIVWKDPNFSQKLKYHLKSQPFSPDFRWSVFKSLYEMPIFKKSSFQMISVFGCPEFGFPTCCVLWPARDRCANPRAGWNTFYSCFQLFFFF